MASSILTLAKQQKVSFDPAKKQHRNAFYEYLAKGQRWGEHNIFVLEQDYASIPDMIKSKLVEFYTNREFSK